MAAEGLSGAVKGKGKSGSKGKSKAAAEDFATKLFGEAPPPLRKPIPTKGWDCTGYWMAQTPDGITIAYRSAGQASGDNLVTTATVEINSDKHNAVNLNRKNLSKVVKLKFPKAGE